MLEARIQLLMRINKFFAQEKIAALNRKREIEELKIRAREGQRRKAAYKELVRVNLILDNPREAADSIYCLRHLLPQAEERREINEVRLQHPRRQM
jgi:hypothetical protein